MKKVLFLILFVLPFIFSFQGKPAQQQAVGDSIHYAREKHFKNIRQLTFGADNAEAYWSFDGKSITFQSNNAAWGLHCDQVFTMPVEGMDLSQGAKPNLI